MIGLAVRGAGRRGEQAEVQNNHGVGGMGPHALVPESGKKNRRRPAQSEPGPGAKQPGPVFFPDYGKQGRESFNKSILRPDPIITILRRADEAILK